VCLHGFTDTWRTWELVLPELERRHDVLAPTLLGHAGGPPLSGPMSDAAIADEIERAMDAAGFATAHIAGNSLGGYVALQLAARGRARSVVALAPAGGWADGDDSFRDALAYFASTQEALKSIAPHAEAIAATAEGRRQATQFITTNFEHIPPELIAHLIAGAANCAGVHAMIDHALRKGWSPEPERIKCPVRILWGTGDRLLRWPSSATRYRRELPHADWIELDGVGHCPQLDVPFETAQLILGFTGAA
jgi:pimeloyl-ACP methyl ester carboxylesterase